VLGAQGRHANACQDRNMQATGVYLLVEVEVGRVTGVVGGSEVG